MDLPLLIVPILAAQANVIVEHNIQFSPEQELSSIMFHNETWDNMIMHTMYAKDIDGDGVDEVFVAGVETQPNTPEKYTNISMFIYGWQNGVLQDITSTWLPNGINNVEGVGDITFGDFDGDGDLDVYLSAYTDMDFNVNSYQLTNNGGYFTRDAVSARSAEHGVGSGDINNDGYDDVLVGGYNWQEPLVYLGSETGLYQAPITSNNMIGKFGSGVAVADFLGNGTQTAVYVDAIADDLINRTKLASFDVAYGEVEVTEISVLPTPILATQEFKTEYGITGSHAVRAKPMDFNNDGLMDVLVFDRAWMDSDGHWPSVSALQFLKNTGAGNFVDVTDTVLVNYDHNTSTGYSPVIADFNNDGLLDIYLGDADWNEDVLSYRIIFQQRNGKFVDSLAVREEFGTVSGDTAGTFATGPDGLKYYVRSEQTYGTALTRMFYSVLTTY